MKARKEIVIAIAVGLALVAFYFAGIWAALAVGAAVLFLAFRAPILHFTGQVRVELDKCSWPWEPNQTGFKRYKELLDSTFVVIISVVLLAGFVTTCDWILAHLVGALTGTAIGK